MTKTNTEAVEALRPYLRHNSQCKLYANTVKYDCTCGLSKAIESALSPTAKTEPSAAGVVDRLRAVLRNLPYRYRSDPPCEERQAIVAAIAALSAPTREREWSRASIDVVEERKRQQEVEGWTAEHDDSYREGILANAAECYLAAFRERHLRDEDSKAPLGWPWDKEWWKPSDKRRSLVKAAALIIAEIDRFDRNLLNEGSGQ